MEPTNLNSKKISKKANPMEKLVERVAEDFQGREVTVETLENHKISNALIEFIEPYRYEAQEDESFSKLLNVGIIAWNLSFFSKQEQKIQIEEIFLKKSCFSSEIDQEFKNDFKSMMKTLIARKKRYFSSYKRFIVEFELDNNSDNNKFHLYVVSMPMNKKLSL